MVLVVHGENPEEIAEALPIIKEQIQQGYTAGDEAEGWDLSEEDEE